MFGTELNKELLVSFLNALLQGKERVKDVTYLNTEQLGAGELDRRAVFDVYCENERGEKFLVEMQKGEQEFFKDRSVYYATFPLREQATRGSRWNYELKAVYAIGILNFTFDEVEEGKFRHDVMLMETDTKRVFYDKLKFIYLEMPKFDKEEGELETMFDKWLFVLKNLSRLMERPAALQERVFRRLFEAAEIARFSRRELLEYEESLKVYRDWFSVLSTAEKKGLKRGMRRGMKEGLKAGMEKERMTIARRLKEGGMTDEEVARVTGMEVELVRKIGEERTGTEEGGMDEGMDRERVERKGRGRGTSEERRAGEEGGEGDEGGGR